MSSLFAEGSTILCKKLSEKAKAVTFLWDEPIEDQHRQRPKPKPEASTDLGPPDVFNFSPMNNGQDPTRITVQTRASNCVRFTPSSGYFGRDANHHCQIGASIPRGLP